MVNRLQAIAATFAVAGLAFGTVLSVSNPASAQRVVTCESDNYHTTSCPINTTNGVRLVKQLSKKSCERNWGVGRNRVWVRNGCRAEFAANFRRR